MIESRDDKKIVMLNGVSFVKSAAVKTEAGKMAQLDGVVLHGAETTKTAMPKVVTTNEVRSFFCIDIVVPEGSVWDITGTVTPVGSVVHMGDASKFDPLNPTNGEIAAVESDETGYFEFLGVDGIGTLRLWVYIYPSLFGYSTTNIEHTATLASLQENGILKAYAGVAPPPSGYDGTEDDCPTAEITISGECPEGATVYISRGDETKTHEELIGTIDCVAKNTTAKTYSATFEGGWNVGYVAWCESPDGELTATMEYTETAVCLSGDTQITLADGSTKRLDELTDDDVLLSGDGKPTKIVKRKRGIFNSRHTYYTFEDGTVIDEVHAHRFYNVEQGFWQHLGNWKIGEHAKRQDGKTVALVSVDRMDERAEMFGLWTESHDYWANGLLSGETAANESLIADATAEQAADMVASLSEKWIDALSGLGGLFP